MSVLKSNLVVILFEGNELLPEQESVIKKVLYNPDMTTWEIYHISKNYNNADIDIHFDILHRARNKQIWVHVKDNIIPALLGRLCWQSGQLFGEWADTVHSNYYLDYLNGEWKIIALS